MTGHSTEPPTATIRLYCFHSLAGRAHPTPLVQETLSWAAVTMPSAEDGGRIALVAASSEVWSSGPSAIRRGLLALSTMLECEAVTGMASDCARTPYRVPTVWILQTPHGQYHLAHVAYNFPAAAWSLVPSLNPDLDAGTRPALLMLFPAIVGDAATKLDENFWRKP